VEWTEVQDQSRELRALLPGTVTIAAVLGSLRAEAELTLIDDSENALSDLHLVLESEPGGAGERLKAGRKETAGTLLTVYAVVRDETDAFVVDVPVSWRVSGETAASESTSYGLRLLTAGTTTLRASHEELGSAELALEVTPGPVFRMTIDPESKSLRAGDPSLTFSVSALDEYGNSTADLGEITYGVSEGSLSEFDAISGTLTPELISTGRVTAKSSYGVEVTSGTIAVSAGPLARLSITPDTLQLTADSEPVQFQVTGVDQFDN